MTAGRIGALILVLALASIAAVVVQNPDETMRLMEESSARYLRKPSKALLQNNKHKQDDPNLNLKGPWPECQGLTGEDCEAVIRVLSGDPNIQTQIVWPTDFSFPDFSKTRVKIYVNNAGMVTSTPERGN